MSSSSKAQVPSEENGEARRAMRELGFSEAECTVYFELLAKPTGDAIDNILSRSKASTAKTEDAVKGLVDKGLVRITSNRLEVSEPKLFLSKFQAEKRLEMGRRIESMNATASRLLSILEPQYWEARLGVKPQDLLEPLPTLEAMEIQTIKILANASREVAISAENFGWLDKVREELDKGLERGVKFRVLMKVKDAETATRAEELTRMKIDIRTSQEEWYPVRGTLCDDRELVFLIWTGRESQKERPKFYRPHYSRNPGMIRVFADAFERRWVQAGRA